MVRVCGCGGEGESVGVRVRVECGGVGVRVRVECGGVGVRVRAGEHYTNTVYTIKDMFTTICSSHITGTYDKACSDIRCEQWLSILDKISLYQILYPVVKVIAVIKVIQFLPVYLHGRYGVVVI